MQHARSLIFVETCRIFFSCGMWDLVPRPGVKSTYKGRRHEFNLWVRKKPWRRKWQSTSVFFFFLYHFTILAWRIPQTEELVGLQSVGSQRFRYNLATKTTIFKMSSISYKVWAFTHRHTVKNALYLKCGSPIQWGELEALIWSLVSSLIFFEIKIWRNLIFQWSCMDVRVGLWRKLSPEKLMLLNCGVGEDSREALGVQGDPPTPS